MQLDGWRSARSSRFHGRFVHSERMTFAWWRIEPGAEVPEHDHPHEQVVNVLEGSCR